MTESSLVRFRLCLPVAAIAFAVAASPTYSAITQQEAGASEAGWNEERTVEIVRQAIASRYQGRDTGLERYSAYAEGQVHYLAEYGDELRDQAVRSDRIALELRWRRGVGSLQTIVGRRHASWMPTTVKYHVDHLSLVVENFGNRIRIGDGDEVRDVLNPVAPKALEFYEYRLVDSLSILVNDDLTELYRLEVRPMNPDSAGVVGTIDLERTSYALVRLAVTFTPRSYVDPSVRSVSVDLQNALVANRHWLPAEQHTEVRRQLRFLDLPFGGTIRTRFRVLSWDLDPPKDVWVPVGHRVRSVPREDLWRYAGWRTWDMHGEPELLRADSALFEKIRTDAVQVVRGRYLGGTSRLRLHAPSLSSVLRVRRAEGFFAGMGARFDVDGHWTLGGRGGYAFGAERFEGSLELQGRFGGLLLGAEGFIDRPSDIGPWGAASGLISTGGALLRGEDFLDPYFESGGRVFASHPLGGGRVSLALATSDQEPAELHLDPLGDVEARAVLPIAPGTDTRITVGYDRQLPPILGSKLHLGLDTDLATFGSYDYTRWVVDATATPTEPDATWAWEGRAGAGLTTGSPPVQRMLRFGGRGTVPGYEYRRFNGEQVAFVNLALSRSMLHPWLRLRGRVAIGWSNWSHGDEETVRLTDPRSVEPFALETPDSDGLRPAVGAGLSVLYDLVRLDVARGLDDGVWEWALSVNPQFESPL